MLEMDFSKAVDNVSSSRRHMGSEARWITKKKIGLVIRSQC